MRKEEKTKNEEKTKKRGKNKEKRKKQRKEEKKFFVFSSFLIHYTTLVSQNYLVCLAVEQQIVYISRFYSIAALCITFTEMCLLSFETSSLLFYCFRFYFLLMMDIAKSETFKNFIILNKALLFVIKLSKTAVQSVLTAIKLRIMLHSYCYFFVYCVFSQVYFYFTSF